MPRKKVIEPPTPTCKKDGTEVYPIGGKPLMRGKIPNYRHVTEPAPCGRIQLYDEDVNDPTRETADAKD
jgi:hypothetical protein